jgi:hypothetical protein
MGGNSAPSTPLGVRAPAPRPALPNAQAAPPASVPSAPQAGAAPQGSAGYVDPFDQYKKKRPG